MDRGSRFFFIDPDKSLLKILQKKGKSSCLILNFYAIINNYSFDLFYLSKSRLDYHDKIYFLFLAQVKPWIKIMN